MARVEPINNGKILRTADIKEIKKAIKDSAKQTGKRLSLGCSCCLVIIFLFLFFIMGFSYYLSKTGLVNVPIFSRFYKMPLPKTEKIIKEPIDVHEIEKRVFKEILSGREYIELTLFQGEFNWLVSEYLLKDNKEIEKLLIFLEEQQIEIYFVSKNFLNSPLIISFNPVITNNSISFLKTHVQLGELSVPDKLSSFVLNKIIGKYGEKLNDYFKYVKEIDLFPEGITLTVNRQLLNILMPKDE